MNQPYRPANGSEGMDFMEQFCVHCRHHDYDNGVYCEILGRTMAYKITDPEYPVEWVQDDDGNNPRCTAFERKEQSCH